MNYLNYFVDGIKNFKDFDGRASVKQFWMFVLFNLVFSAVANGVDAILGTTIIGILYSLVLLVPGIAIAVRRLHDINKSGWWYLIGLIPLIGWIWLIILFIKAGDAGKNQYGAAPQE